MTLAVPSSPQVVVLVVLLVVVVVVVEADAVAIQEMEQMSVPTNRSDAPEWHVAVTMDALVVPLHVLWPTMSSLQRKHNSRQWSRSRSLYDVVYGGSKIPWNCWVKSLPWSTLLVVRCPPLVVVRLLGHGWSHDGFAEQNVTSRLTRNTGLEPCCSCASTLATSS